MKSTLLPGRSNNRERSGSAIVEVAVCFPVFLMILLGIVEFGRAMSVNQLLNSSARIGCRAAILDGSTNTAVTNTVKAHVASTINCSQSIVTVTINITRSGVAVTSLSSARTGDVITIDVKVPFANVSWAVTKHLTSKSVKGQCSMQHE